MTTAQQHQTVKESDVCNYIGWALIALGFIAGFIFILVFGRIEIASGYYGTTKIWSGTMICMGAGIMLNGFLIGYLFQKIASILRYHERKEGDHVEIPFLASTIQEVSINKHDSERSKIHLQSKIDEGSVGGDSLSKRGIVGIVLIFSLVLTIAIIIVF